MLIVNPVNGVLMLVSHPELRANFIASHLGYCWGLVCLVSTSYLSPGYFFTFLLFLVAESFLSQGAVSMPGWETAVSWACALKLLGRSTSWLGVLPGTRHSESRAERSCWHCSATGSRSTEASKSWTFLDMILNVISVKSVLLCVPLWLYMDFISFKPHLPYKRQYRGVCLGCGFSSPGRGMCGRQPISVSCVNVSSSAPPPSFYSLKSMEKMSKGED